MIYGGRKRRGEDGGGGVRRGQRQTCRRCSLYNTIVSLHTLYYTQVYTVLHTGIHYTTHGYTLNHLIL